MSKMIWTAEQIRLLTAYHTDGLQYAEIATRLRSETGYTFSKAAIGGMAQRLGLKRRFTKGVKTPRAATPPKPRRRSIRAGFKTGTDRKPADPVVDWFERFSNPDHLGISFHDLKPSHCRFPKGDGLSATYCGQPVKEGQSYCPHCYSICYEKPTRPTQNRMAA